MKKSVFALALFSVALLFSCKDAPEKTAEKERTVSVHGEGSISLEPDSVSLIFSVSSENWDVNAAVQDAAVRMTAVQSALGTNGIEEKYISTFDYGIRQEYAYTTDKRRYRNYIVTNKMCVVITDVKSAGKVIDAAIAAGANELSSFSYNVKDDSEAVKKARMLAVKQAEDAAQMLAGATGATLGKIVSINEYSSGNAYTESDAVMRASKTVSNLVSTPLPTGSKTVSVTVDCVWELE